MKTIRRILLLFIFFLLIQPSFSFGKKDTAEEQTAPASEKKTEIQNDHLKIDFLFDTKKENSKNRFNWSTTSTKYNDSFDAVSGASKLHSTKNLREAVLDKEAKVLKIPKGLYCLCLYAVSNSGHIKSDNFQINQEGKKLTITFSRRGYSYKIITDENGLLSVPGSFYIKQEAKTEDARGEAKTPDSEEDSENPEQKAEFILDEGNKALKAFYNGNLKAVLSPEGILTVKGKLKLTAKEEKKDDKADKADKVKAGKDFMNDSKKPDEKNKMPIPEE